MKYTRLRLIFGIVAAGMLAFGNVYAEELALDVADNGHARVTVGAECPVFTEAQPLLRAGSEADELPLPFHNARLEKAEVADALGAGVRTTLAGEGCEWQITTYPGKPFFTVRLLYENTGNADEKIKKLVPWASGGCTLGENTSRAPVLDNGLLTRPQASLFESDEKNISSLWNLAVYNPAAGAFPDCGIPDQRALLHPDKHRARRRPRCRFFRALPGGMPLFPAHNAGPRRTHRIGTVVSFRGRDLAAGRPRTLREERGGL